MKILEIIPQLSSGGGERFLACAMSCRKNMM